MWALLITALVTCYNFCPRFASAERFLLSWLPPRVDQTPDLRPLTRRGTRRARMWLINWASHEVSRGTNSNAINRNQRLRKDRLGKILILMQRYSIYIFLTRVLSSICDDKHLLIEMKFFANNFLEIIREIWDHISRSRLKYVKATVLKEIRTVCSRLEKMCNVGTKVLKHESPVFGDLPNRGRYLGKKGILEPALTFRVNIYTDKYHKYWIA